MLTIQIGSAVPKCNQHLLTTQLQPLPFALQDIKCSFYFVYNKVTAYYANEGQRPPLFDPKSLTRNTTDALQLYDECKLIISLDKVKSKNVAAQYHC